MSKDLVKIDREDYIEKNIEERKKKAYQSELINQIEARAKWPKERSSPENEITGKPFGIFAIPPLSQNEQDEVCQFALKQSNHAKAHRDRQNEALKDEINRIAPYYSH